MTNKEQWDYIGNKRIGPNQTIAYNALYARYVNPFTEKIKLIKIEEGEECTSTP